MYLTAKSPYGPGLVTPMGCGAVCMPGCTGGCTNACTSCQNVCAANCSWGGQ